MKVTEAAVCLWHAAGHKNQRPFPVKPHPPAAPSEVKQTLLKSQI